MDLKNVTLLRVIVILAIDFYEKKIGFKVLVFKILILRCSIKEWDIKEVRLYYSFLKHHGFKSYPNLNP